VDEFAALTGFLCLLSRERGGSQKAETMNCLGKTFDKKHKIDCICNQNQFEMSLGMLLQHPAKGEGGP
jgi:hypothetical protein